MAGQGGEKGREGFEYWQKILVFQRLAPKKPPRSSGRSALAQPWTKRCVLKICNNHANCA
jgi:hypothetical protein